MRKCTFLLVLAPLLIGGCGGGEGRVYPGQDANPREGSDEIRLSVGNRIITSDEIIAPVIEGLRQMAEEVNDFEQFKEYTRPELEMIVVGKILRILLYQKVKRDLGEKIDGALERKVGEQVRKLIADKGSYAKAEEYLKENGQDWDSFKQSWRNAILIGWQMPKPRPITYSELLAYYDQMKDESFGITETITIRLIDIEVSKMKVADPNEDKEELASKLANDLVKCIREGDDFDALARRYSHGYRRDVGGLWPPRQPQDLEKPYDILAVKAKNMKPGDITPAIVSKRKDHIFIMKLEDRQDKGFKPLAEVQRQVEQRIIRDRQTHATNKLDKELAQQVALVERSEFVDFCLRNIWRMTKAKNSIQ